MKKIYVAGSKVGVLEVDRVEDKLSVGNYNIQFDARTGEVSLSIMSDLKLPATEFLDTSIADRWLQSFKNFDTNLGILLSGLKGAGKTVLAKKLCIKSNLPVLHLNAPIPCSALSEFLANPMFHNCIVFIDEFEKVINQEDESIASWLKLMDGGFNTKLLFLMTSNGEEISDFLMNRLSRIKYRKHFTTLSDETIQRIIDEFLNDSQFEEDLKQTCNKISLLSIDILVNIIQEINLFHEPASEIVKHLNLVNARISMYSYEKYNGEWKECGYLYTDVSKLSNEVINRSWVETLSRSIRDKVNAARYENNELSEYEILTKEEIEILNMSRYYEFKNPNVNRIKEDYIITEGNYEFKLVPVEKSNMLF